MALSRREELLSYISDAYKDANGFRPRGLGYNEMSVVELEAEAEYLSKAVGEAIAEERKNELRLRAKWEESVNAALEAGAPDRESAVRWLFDAENFGEEEDAGYINFKFGVGYDYDLLKGAANDKFAWVPRDGYDAILLAA